MTNNIVIYKLCFVFTQVVFVLWQVLVSELIKYEMLTKTEEIRMGANTFAMHYMIISLYHLFTVIWCFMYFCFV